MLKYLTTATLALFMIGCGGGYVQQGYVQPAYEPGLTVVYHGGHQGYWVGGVFQPMVVINGASGYYRGNTFVSSHVSIQTAARENRPIYRGSTTTSTAVKPNYSSGVSTVTKSTQAAPARQSTGSTMRTYGGAVTTPSARPSYTPPSRPSYSAPRPSYSSGSGSVTRSSGRR